jgi:choice-of-anchor A domain-containing protein
VKSNPLLATIPALTILVLAGVPAAHATTLTLGQASSYDVFVFGNFTESGTDSQGRVAVGGNFAPANGGGFSIASQLSDQAGTYDLVAGGNFTNNGYSVGGGDAFVGGNLNWTDPTLPHNVYVNGSFTNNSGGGTVGGKVYYAGTSCTSGDPISCVKGSATASPIDFVGAQTNLDTVSSTLAGQTANGTTSFDGYSTYTLTGTSSTLNVFNLTNSTYNGQTINITAPASSTVVVNVAGTSDSITGGSINLNGVPATNVIFNFSAATSVSIANLAFNGTLLAPYANFSGTWGQLNGELIAESAQGTTEFHNVLFSGTLPSASGTLSGTSDSGGGATPEPSTWLMLLGGGGLIAISRRRKSSRH